MICRVQRRDTHGCVLALESLQSLSLVSQNPCLVSELWLELWPSERALLRETTQKSKTDPCSVSPALRGRPFSAYARAFLRISESSLFGMQHLFLPIPDRGIRGSQ